MGKPSGCFCGADAQNAPLVSGDRAGWGFTYTFMEQFDTGGQLWTSSEWLEGRHYPLWPLPTIVEVGFRPPISTIPEC